MGLGLGGWDLAKALKRSAAPEEEALRFRVVGLGSLVEVLSREEGREAVSSFLRVEDGFEVGCPDLEGSLTGWNLGGGAIGRTGRLPVRLLTSGFCITPYVLLWRRGSSLAKTSV